MLRKFSIMLFLFIFYSYSYAVDFSSLPNKELNCPGANKNANIYITTGQTSFSTRISDVFWHPSDRYIANAGTLAKLWTSDSNLVSSCITSSDWSKVSDVAPGNNEQVVAISSMCTFNKPTNVNNKTLQFVFNIKHGAIGGGTTTVTRYYYPKSGWFNNPATRLSKTYSNYFVSDYVVMSNECLNITLAWCGDSVLDSANGETCDDGNNLNGDSCNSTCQTTLVPSIQIDKRDANSADIDGNVGNDTQTVYVGSGAIFKIKVTNNGPEALRNLALTDAIAPNCGGNVTLPGTYPSTWSAFVQGGAGIHTNDTLEPGEFFEYTCDKTNTTVGYTNSATVNGVGVTSNQGVTATDNTVVLISTGVSCNSLIANPTTGNAPLLSNFTCAGTNATSYRIDIKNSGGTVLSTINTQTGSYTFTSTGTYTAQCFVNGNITSNACGASGSVSLTVGLSCTNGGVSGNQSNPITSSTTGLCQTGATLSNFLTSTSGNSTVYSWSCNGLSGPACTASYTPNSGTCTSGGVTGTQSNPVSSSTTGLCQPGATLSNFLSSTSGNTTNYTWSCNGLSGGSCYASYSSGGGGGGGGGGSGPSCLKIEIPVKTSSNTGSETDVTCIGNYKVSQIMLDCGNGQTSTKSVTTTPFSEKSASFKCNYGTTGTFTPKCFVSSSTTGVPTVSSLSCSTKVAIGRSYCGDGVLQRPNDDGGNEECEKSRDSGGNLVFPSWCSATCKINTTTIPSGDNGVLTYPAGGSVYFRPFGQVIIGEGSNPFTLFGSEPYLGNDSGEDIYFEKKFCVYNTDSSALNKGTNPFSVACTSNIVGWLYPGSLRSFKDMNSNVELGDIVGSKVTGNVSYKDTVLKTTLEGLDWAYFTASLKVRVSKPAISTVGGGTSVIKNSNTTSDVSKVSLGGYSDPNKNKNFVGVGVGTGGVSSFTNKVTSTGAVQKVATTGQKLENSVSKVSKITSSVVPTINKDINSITSKYNGLDNVFIVKNANLVISSTISGTGPRTYIIEGGNLKINQDITYADNIAFVVKGGNVIIASGVKKINGTFIVIPVSGVGGLIKSDYSSEKLIVSGSLYGDISGLVSNRVFIENKNDIINVGTIVSFGSSLFMKEAPLVGDFIAEYTKSNKVAK